MYFTLRGLREGTPAVALPLLRILRPSPEPPAGVRAVEIIEPARVESRPEVPYVGIRVVTPFRGMLGASDKLFAELSAWVEQSGVETLGHGLVRLHVIDMSGPMDLEVGLVTPRPTDFVGRGPRRRSTSRPLRHADPPESCAEGEPRD